MSRTRVRLLISGVVQGVAFRYHTKRMADGLGLDGWVRNLPDGRVEAHFEGPPEVVAQAEEWCRRGPAHARVRGVERQVVEPLGHALGFGIRR